MRNIIIAVSVAALAAAALGLRVRAAVPRQTVVVRVQVTSADPAAPVRFDAGPLAMLAASPGRVVAIGL